ncbi:MAG: YegS/Rv2252/BmrU family lipid kinase [Bacillota bacterium]|nr:YegS/Rv2252/BmrU family lipid kinase [Bacillota bacterium]
MNGEKETKITETKKEQKKKVLLYYNAYSGSGVFKNNLDHIVERIQNAGYQTIPVRTAKGVVIDEVLSNLDQSEYDRIIVAGGDGTVNLCVNAMIKHDIHLPIGILPAGTANDFAYYFELPSDIDYQLDIALGDKTTKVDVGEVNGRNFVNVAAMGALIDVSQKTDPNLKNAIGVLAYYLKAVTEIPQLHAIPVKLTTPDAVHFEDIYFMVVMNGESAGGFRKLSPQSSMNDGKLDVIAFRKMPIMELGPLLFEVVNGRHPNNKNVLYFQTEELLIESTEDISTDIDGERGEPLPLKFKVINERLDVFVSERDWHYDD